jgi:hypothetical protein
MKNWALPAAGILLIAAGALGLGRGEFSYTKEKHEASIAGLEFSLKEKETVNVPKWAAGGAIAIGALLLLFGRRP